jgi:hypothetical protein
MGSFLLCFQGDTFNGVQQSVLAALHFKGAFQTLLREAGTLERGVHRWEFQASRWNGAEVNNACSRFQGQRFPFIARQFGRGRAARAHMTYFNFVTVTSSWN